jgi:3-oxocholest-4-en-26-oate---CoA ligase
VRAGPRERRDWSHRRVASDAVGAATCSKGRSNDMTALLYADVWESIADAVPERSAMWRGDRRILWGDFDRRADALARHLLDAGLERHAKVGALLYNAPEYLETYFAAFKVGLAPFNTNYRYGGDELLYLFDNADAEAIVFHASFAARLATIRAQLPRVKTWIAVPEAGQPCPEWAVDYDTLVATRVDRAFAPWGRSELDPLLMYTGGTTGLPKGVLWPQRDLFQSLGGGSNLLLGWGPITRASEAGERTRLLGEAGRPTPPVTIAAAPLMHATGQFVSLTALSHGGTIVALPSQRFDAQELWSEVERTCATSVIIVGMAFSVPMLEALDAQPERWKLGSLRRVMSSGTIWSAENKQGLLRHLPDVMMIDSLGSSEAVGVAASLASRGAPIATARFAIGPNTAVFSEAGQRVEPGSGERGLLALGGPLPSGYYKDELKSAQAFRTFEGSRWSVPGDWALVEADGSITLLGRGSQVINTGGEKVFPEEVEESLKLYPGVRDAAVVGLPDPRFGERICAVVELAPGMHATLELLAEHVKTTLAPFKAPRALVLARVVRQPNGKLDYSAIRRDALARQQSG